MIDQFLPGKYDPPAFALKLAHKDVSLANALGRELGVPMRMCNLTHAGRTFSQLRNRGLLGAAEASVIRSKPTQGFQGLSEADLADLSYEQIIVDHPQEFSARAQWYARRTLGLPNESDKPPAKGASLTQERTEVLLRWLEARSTADGGHLRGPGLKRLAAVVESIEYPGLKVPASK